MERFLIDDLSDDHILARYWLILVRRWWVVATVFVLMLLGGIVYAKTRAPVPFPHITTIEVGRFADGSILEETTVVETKLQGAYIPTALQEHANKHGYDQESYSIKVEVPEGGNTILLKSYGSDNDTSTLLALQQRTLDLLVQDHKHKTVSVKQALEQQLFKARIVLDDLEAQARLIPRKRQIIDETGQLLKRQIETVVALITTVEKDRTSAIASAIGAGSVDQSFTTAILLMNTTIAENRDKLRGLEERYYITLQNDRGNIDREEATNKLAQKEQERVLNEVEFRTRNIQETKALLSPSRQLRESPRGPFQIVELFGAIGLFLGLFAALFVEFASNARKYERTMSAR